MRLSSVLRRSTNRKSNKLDESDVFNPSLIDTIKLCDDEDEISDIYNDSMQSFGDPPGEKNKRRASKRVSSGEGHKKSKRGSASKKPSNSNKRRETRGSCVNYNAKDNNKDATIQWLVQTLFETNKTLSETNMAMEKLQHQVNNLEAKLASAASSDHAIDEPSTTNNSKVVVVADSVNDSSKQAKPSLPDKKKKRSSKIGKSGDNKKTRKVKVKKRRKKSSSKKNLDPEFLKTTFKTNVKKLITMNTFFSETALKAVTSEHNVDKRSFERSNSSLRDCLVRNRRGSNASAMSTSCRIDMTGGVVHESARMLSSKDLSPPVKSALADPSAKHHEPKTVQWNDDNSDLLQVWAVPYYDQDCLNDIFVSDEEIKLARFEVYMEENADEFEIIDSDEESDDDEYSYYEEEIIEEYYSDDEEEECDSVLAEPEEFNHAVTSARTLIAQRRLSC